MIDISLTMTTDHEDPKACMEEDQVLEEGVWRVRSIKPWIEVGIRCYIECDRNLGRNESTATSGVLQEDRGMYKTEMYGQVCKRL